MPQVLRTLGDHLRKHRFELRLMQREVAQQLGVPASTYPSWEDSLRMPKARNRRKIIKYLGYDPFALLGYKGK